jgi:hypothetical protein
MFEQVLMRRIGSFALALTLAPLAAEANLLGQNAQPVWYFTRS